MNTGASTIYGWAALAIGAVFSYVIAKKELDARRIEFIRKKEAEMMPELKTYEERMQYFENKAAASENAISKLKQVVDKEKHSKES